MLGAPFHLQAEQLDCAVRLKSSLCPRIVSSCSALVVAVVTFPFHFLASLYFHLSHRFPFAVARDVQ